MIIHGNSSLRPQQLFLRLHRCRLSSRLRQSGCSLRVRQGRSRHLLHGCPQARAHHEVSCASRHGWYLGYLRHDCGSHHRTEKYHDFDLVPSKDYTANAAYAHLASGLCCGFSSLAAGLAIGIVGDAGVRANAQQDKIFVGMILILIFGEALALYGLIVSLILTSQG